MSIIMHKAFGWKRSRISMLEVEAIPQRNEGFFFDKCVTTSDQQLSTTALKKTVCTNCSSSFASEVIYDSQL
jgi:hypothetical protein